MLIILNNEIRMIDGLYSLNDIHKASGGLIRHKPSDFMNRKDTQIMIAELNAENSRFSSPTRVDPVSTSENIQSDIAIHDIYVCHELIYSYAMWVSPLFHLSVIRAFDSITNQQQKLSEQLNQLCNQLNTVDDQLTKAGRLLCVGGKQIKPSLKKSINSIHKQMQLSLGLELPIDSNS